MHRYGSFMSIRRRSRRWLGTRMCQVCWLLEEGRRISIYGSGTSSMGRCSVSWTLVVKYALLPHLFLFIPHNLCFFKVCNLIWSLTSHELVSTHGFSSTTAQNQICIWKYPTLNMVASLTGHTNRVLYLAMSPDGETIVTGAGDETLRFWNAFPKKEKNEREKESRLDYGRLIR